MLFRSLVLADLNAEPGKKTYTGGNYKNGVITIDENLGVSYLEHVLLHELVHADLALNSNLAAGTKLSEFWARYYQTDYNGGNFNAEAAMNFISTTSSYINLPHH